MDYSQLSDSYLEYALRLKQQEVIVRQSINSLLPDNIIDSHSHSGLREHITYISPEILKRPGSTFLSFSLNQSKVLGRILYQKNNIRYLRFGFPIFGIDFKKANQYLVDNCQPQDKIALVGIPYDIEYTIRELRSRRFSALKIYPVSSSEIGVNNIYDFFKKEILEEAQSLNIPIILHLPKSISHSIDDLKKLLKDFSSLRVVLAHIGLSRSYSPELVNVFEEFVNSDLLLFDTSTVCSKDVIRLAINLFGENRIIFGSDEPFNLIRWKIISLEDGSSCYMSDFHYHWIPQDLYKKYKHLAKTSIHCHWQSIDAITKAIPHKKMDHVLNKIFYENSAYHFGFK